MLSPATTANSHIFTAPAGAYYLRAHISDALGMTKTFQMNLLAASASDEIVMESVISANAALNAIVNSLDSSSISNIINSLNIGLQNLGATDVNFCDILS